MPARQRGSAKGLRKREEFGRLERLGADRRRLARSLRSPRQRAPGRHPREHSAFASVLRRCPKAACTTRFVAARAVRQPVCAGRRRARSRRSVPAGRPCARQGESRCAARQLDEHGDRAVGLRPRAAKSGRRPRAAPSRTRARAWARQALGHDRSGDVVRQIRDQLGWSRVERGEVEREGVAEDEVDVGATGERLRQVGSSERSSSTA